MPSWTAVLNSLKEELIGSSHGFATGWLWAWIAETQQHLLRLMAPTLEKLENPGLAEGGDSNFGERPYKNTQGWWGA